MRKGLLAAFRRLQSVCSIVSPPSRDRTYFNPVGLGLVGPCRDAANAAGTWRFLTVFSHCHGWMPPAYGDFSRHAVTLARSILEGR